MSTMTDLAAALAQDRGGDAEDYSDELVTSRSTLASFVEQWGKPARTIGDVAFWDQIQTRPGRTRGDLAVIATVDGSLSWFNGEA